MSTTSTPTSPSMEPCFDADGSPTVTTTTTSSSSLMMSIPFRFHSVLRIGSTTTTNPALGVRAEEAPYFPTDDILEDTNLATLGRRRYPRPRASARSHTEEDSDLNYGNYSTPRWGFTNVTVPPDANPFGRCEGGGCSRMHTTSQLQEPLSTRPAWSSSTTAEAELSCIAQQDTNSSNFFCMRTNNAMFADTDSTTPATTTTTVAPTYTSRLPLLSLGTYDDEDNEDVEDDHHHSRSRPRILLPMRRTNTMVPLPWLADH